MVSHIRLEIKPLMACHSAYAERMAPPTAKDNLKRNLEALKSKDGTRLLSAGQLALAKKAGIGEGTVSRARRGVGNTTIKSLEAIAAVYKVEPWQLLAANLGQEPASKTTVAASPPPPPYGGISDEATQLASAFDSLSRKDQRAIKPALLRLLAKPSDGATPREPKKGRISSAREGPPGRRSKPKSLKPINAQGHSND